MRGKIAIGLSILLLVICIILVFKYYHKPVEEEEQAVEKQPASTGYVDPTIGGVIDSKGRYIESEPVEDNPIVPYADETHTKHIIDREGAEKMFNKVLEQENITCRYMDITSGDEARQMDYLSPLAEQYYNDLMWYCDIMAEDGEHYSIVILNDEQLISDIPINYS